MATRGTYIMYINDNSMVEIFGGIPKILALCSFLRKLMVSDKQIHMAFRTHITL